jgi:ketosteroid isomerase-like protein
MPDNTAVIRNAYQAFAGGDIPTVLAALSADVVWHVPGRSPLSGDYHGHDGVMEFFGTCMELSGGTLRVAVDDLLADGERVVALATVSAERNGRRWSSPEVHVWRVTNGQAVEFREYQGDQQTEDEFWSS